MKEELKTYSDGFDNPSRFNEWYSIWESNKKITATQEQLEHIIDYLVANPTRLERATEAQLLDASEKWSKTLQKKGEHIKETAEDTEVVLDFKDGFKIVKLVGKSAYEREGYLMRHCVASYYGNEKEVYSLRDKNNAPHCTMEKDQQIKGKGNGNINPKYIKYVVEFLEFTGMEVRDSEMERLGYVNVKEVVKQNPDIKFGKLYKDEYFFKADLEKVENKDDMDLWGRFGLFYFDLNMKVIFNFNVSKSVAKLKAKLKENGKTEKIQKGGNDSKISGGYDSKISGGNDSKIAGGDYSKISGGYDSNISGGDNSNISGGNDSTISGGYDSNISGGDYSKISGGDNSTISGGYDSKISGGDNSTISGGNGSNISGGNDSTISGGDNSTISGGNGSNISGGNDSNISGGDYSKISGGDNSTISGGYDSTISGGNDSKIKSKNCCNVVAGKKSEILTLKGSVCVAGSQSKVKGKIGSAIVLFDRNIQGMVVNIVSVIVDGEKIKEDVWYELRDGELSEG